MADITLSAAVRGSLLSLQNTTSLIERTQGRLSTGLAVGSAMDDPVKFFQAKTLSDRATDFDDKKSGIDQGVSSLTAALDGSTGIEDIVGQLKGLALSAKSSTSATIGELVSQFNDLRTQIDNLASDSTYQGLNLINGTGQTLTVNFSTDTASTLAVASVDITAGAAGLALRAVVTANALGTAAGVIQNVSYSFKDAETLYSSAGGSTITVSISGESNFTLAEGNHTFSYGTHTVTISVGSAGATTASFTSTQTFTAGADLSLNIGSGVAAGSGLVSIAGVGGSAVQLSVGALEGRRVLDSGLSTDINAMVNNLDSALTTLRTKSQNLGSNVALLQTRLDFTKSYVDTLTSGSDKLTLADLNQEGANLLALQTRQQLGISALSFAGQAEQGILSLFR